MWPPWPPRVSPGLPWGNTWEKRQHPGLQFFALSLWGKARFGTLEIQVRGHNLRESERAIERAASGELLLLLGSAEALAGDWDTKALAELLRLTVLSSPAPEAESSPGTSAQQSNLRRAGRRLKWRCCKSERSWQMRQDSLRAQEAAVNAAAMKSHFSTRLAPARLQPASPVAQGICSCPLAEERGKTGCPPEEEACCCCWNTSGIFG